jgi:hypothetical protein
LCFRKVTQEIFSELDETKTEVPIFPRHEMESKEESEGGQGATTPGGGCHDPGFCQILGKNFVFILLEMIENSQGFKTF